MLVYSSEPISTLAPCWGVRSTCSRRSMADCHFLFVVLRSGPWQLACGLAGADLLHSVVEGKGMVTWRCRLSHMPHNFSRPVKPNP